MQNLLALHLVCAGAHADSLAEKLAVAEGWQTILVDLGFGDGH